MNFDLFIGYGPSSSGNRNRKSLNQPGPNIREGTNEARLNLGSAAFSAQYQQAPVQPGGNLIQRDWFKVYDHRASDWFDQIVQSWDTASAVDESNSYSVCLTFGIKENRYYLLDVLREHMTYPDLKATVMRQARIKGANHVLIENASSGISLLDELRRNTELPLVAIQPHGDKISRIEGVSGDIEAGRVWLPEDAPWLATFLNEALAFPYGKHSDQVDALAHFLLWARNRGPHYMKLNYYAFGRNSGVRDRYYERNGRGVFD